MDVEGLSKLKVITRIVFMHRHLSGKLHFGKRQALLAVPAGGHADHWLVGGQILACRDYDWGAGSQS